VSAASSRSARPRALAIVSAAIFATLVLAQGISAPFQKDAEPQSAEWMQSVARGHLLAPRDYYGFLTQKPLLFYWLGAGLTDLTGGGVNEVRSRAVAVASAVALSVIVLVWTSVNVGPIEGWLAFVFLLGTYGFAARAPLALTDMTLTMFVVATLVALYPIVSGVAGERDRRRAIVWALAMMFLGVLTKGPVAIVLPAIAVAIYLLLERRNPLEMLAERWVWSVAIPVIALSIAWYAIWFAFGDPRFRHTFMTENFGHFLPVAAGGTGEGGRPPWFILARLTGGAMPLVLLVPAAIAMLARGEIEESKRGPILYQASLALATIIFFSIASAKRDDYILPALPGIAILSASAFGATASEQGIGARLRSIATMIIAVAMLAGVALAIVAKAGNLAPKLSLDSSDAELLGVLLGRTGFKSTAFAMMIAACSIVVLIAARRGQATIAGISLGVLSLCASLLFTAVVRPDLAVRRSVYDFAPQIRAKVGDGRLCIVDGINYELSFYYGEAVPDLKRSGCASGPVSTPAYLFAYEKEYEVLPTDLRARLKPVLQSKLIGGPGPPALYEIAPSR